MSRAGSSRAERLRSPLLLALWVLLAVESIGGWVIFVAFLVAGRRPGEALHVVAGVALTGVYAVYQWRHWRRVRPLRPRLDSVLGAIAAAVMALTLLSGLILAACWWPLRAGSAGASYPPFWSAFHNIGGMLVLAFVGAHWGAVALRDRTRDEGASSHRGCRTPESRGIRWWGRSRCLPLPSGVAAMSDQSTVVTAEHFRYVAERTEGEDDFLRDLKRAASAEGIPSIWIAPEQASFMQILLRATRTRDVIEVGTLAGYSAIAMARALPPEGRVRTLELDPQRADFARRWVAQSDVAGRVEVLVGPAAETLATMPDASADAVFIDADKGSYPTYLEHTRRLLRDRGLVMVDNAFAFGELFSDTPRDPEVAAVRAFNEQLARAAEFQSVIVPIGDGLWVGVKR